SVSAGRLRPLGSLLERLTIPGIQLHYALRKRRLEEIARASLDEGFTQVVVFGAGFDTLALRLSESFPAARFIETDHPATQKVKTRAIAARGLSGPPNLSFIPLDLTGQNIETELPTRGGFRPREKTLFIAEGVLMYLAPREVDGLFRSVSRLGARGSRFAFTFMEEREDGRVAFRNAGRAVDLWLRLHREPFNWGLRPDQLSGFLAAHGLRVLEAGTQETLRRLYLNKPRLAGLPLAAGECVCLAERR
ncbi:MAG: class I SAM-dependent methyltransferase, partial [Pyrinomonadaceae bacterium]